MDIAKNDGLLSVWVISGVESTETGKYRDITISSLIPMTRLPIVATNSSQTVLNKYEVRPRLRLA